jgi:glycosyltransferase involved in cell wall biosynthesis
MNKLVTLGIICCEQRHFIESVLQGAFAQTYRPLQIVVCDDASTDGTFELATHLAKQCPADIDILVHQNETRLGIGNCNKMAELATGDFIVVAHGDDISLPKRVERLAETWKSTQSSMVTSNAVVINGEGIEQGLYSEPETSYALSSEAIASHGWNPAMLGAVLAFEPTLFTRFRPLDSRKSAFVHDWILPYRASLLNGIHYLPEPLILYRIYDASYTNTFLNAPGSVENVESNQATNIIQYYYMMQDTIYAYQQGYITKEMLHSLDDKLRQSILKAVCLFSAARNKLLSTGKRAQWLAPMT